MFTLTHHQGSFRVLAGRLTHGFQQFGVQAWHIARQHHQVGVACGLQPGANTCQRAREITVVIVYQLIGIGRIAVKIAVAGND
ncbi:hypothetical protein D3C75_1187860 [compost metagenome]